MDCLVGKECIALRDFSCDSVDRFLRDSAQTDCYTAVNAPQRFTHNLDRFDAWPSKIANEAEPVTPTLLADARSNAAASAHHANRNHRPSRGFEIAAGR